MKILIIEDEKLLADSIRTMLESKGFAVDVCYDGESGADYAELGVYDLLILDVMMPGMDGYQVARHVRAQRCSTPHPDAYCPLRAGRPDRGAQRRRRLLSDQAL